MNRVRALLALTVSVLGCAFAGAWGTAAPALAAKRTAGSARADGRGRDCGARARVRRHAGTPAAECSLHPHSSHSAHTHAAHSHAAHTHSHIAKPRALKRPAHVPAVNPPVPAPNPFAVTIARVLATPCQNTQLLPDAENVELVRGAVLCLINRMRADHGEAPLEVDPRLEAAAQAHTQEMVELDYFAHVAPSGLTPVERDQATGYIYNSSVGYVIGENLAWGTLSLSTPEAIAAAWFASPGHLANILESQYQATGIGIVPAAPAQLADGAAGATYAQEFGVIVP